MTEKTQSPGTSFRGHLMEEVIRQARKKYFHALSRLGVELKSVFLSVPPLRMDFSEAMGIFYSCLKDRHCPSRGKESRSVLWMKVLDDGSYLLKDSEATREAFVRVALPLEQQSSILSGIVQRSDGRERPVDEIIGTCLEKIARQSPRTAAAICHWPWMTWWKMTKDRDKKYFFLKEGIYDYCRRWACLDNEAWRPVIAVIEEHFREYPDDRKRMFEAWLESLKYERWDEREWCAIWRGLALISTAAYEPQLYDILVKKIQAQKPPPLSLLCLLGERQPENSGICPDAKLILQREMNRLQAAGDKTWAEVLETMVKRLDGIAVPPKPSAGAGEKLMESLRQLDLPEIWDRQRAMADIVSLCERGQVAKDSPEWNELERKLEALLHQEEDKKIVLQAALLAVRHGHGSQILPPERLWPILLEREARSAPGTWLARGIPLVRQSLLIREFEYWLEEASGKEMAADRGSGIHDNTTWLRGLRSLVHAFPDDHPAFESLRSPATRSAIGVRIWDDVWKTVQKSAGMDNLFSRRKKLEFRCPPGGFRGGLPAWSPPALFKPPSFGPTSFQPTGQPVGQPGVASADKPSSTGSRQGVSSATLPGQTMYRN